MPQPTEKQRLTFNIPNPLTTLNLGVQHADGRGPEGISGVTTRHVYFHGSSTDSTAAIEVPGNVRFHSSGDDLLAVAKKSVLVAGEKNAYLASTERTFVSAGSMGPATVGVGMVKSPAPQSIAAVDEMKTQLEHAKDTIDRTVLIASLALLPATIGQLILTKTVERASLGRSLALNTGKVLLPLTIGVLNKVLAPSFVGGVHVHGGQSALISSGNTITLATLNSISMMAPAIISANAGLAAALTGGASAGITGGITASVTGLALVDVLSFGALTIASRKKNVNVDAESVNIGSRAKRTIQKSTQSVELNARKLVAASVGSAEAVKTRFELNADGATLSGDGHLVNATNYLLQTVGGSSVKIGRDSVTVSASALGANTFKEEVTLAQAAYDAEVAAADKVYDDAVAAITPPGVLALIAAGTIGLPFLTKYNATVKAAKAKLAATIDALNQAVATTLRLKVTSKEAALTNGLAKVSVAAAGTIEIDGGGMPITIKTGAAEIKLTPVGIKMGPMLDQG